MNKQKNQMEWLLNELKKDHESLKNEKLKFISQIKNLKKEEIIPTKKEKISLWQRIKMVLRIS